MCNQYLSGKLVLNCYKLEYHFLFQHSEITFCYFPLPISCKKNEPSLISYTFWEKVRRQVLARGRDG